MAKAELYTIKGTPPPYLNEARAASHANVPNNSNQVGNQCWNKLEKSLFSQAKRDEEEERLEVKDILALKTFKNKIEEEIKPEVVQVLAMDTFGNPSTNTDTDSKVTDVNAAGHVVNNHNTQAKNDEEERLELMKNVFHQEQDRREDEIHTAFDLNGGRGKLKEGMIPITAPDSSLREVIFYLPNTGIAWKGLENGCPDVKMHNKCY
ncbi:uncharacterized protein G2W53_021827 [Senna tora]|uniref:Uncharacterized protein n=1 Tax=Senna tora TaxID=362788 RepID=A0A834WJX7_9FABA|nr:uncharacterized protein G2W53_021827 [Senna tora]